MARSLKKKQRVKDIDGFLGKGSIVKKVKGLVGFYLIKWDKDPPKDYNLGINPCITNEENLIKIRKKR